jgi:hypothetical protein
LKAAKQQPGPQCRRARLTVVGLSSGARYPSLSSFSCSASSDAERVDDRGASLTWIATGAERDDDRGAFMTWTATDAQGDDDVGVPVSRQAAL